MLISNKRELAFLSFFQMCDYENEFGKPSNKVKQILKTKPNNKNLHMCFILSVLKYLTLILTICFKCKYVYNQMLALIYIY